jgi:SAM-dependent methyltransferase
VVSTLAFMDAPDIQSSLKEAFRLLRPGGFIAFSVLHPCFISPGLTWHRDENGRTTSLGVSRYFERDPFVAHWRFGDRPSEEGVIPFVVPCFPRTLSDYLNAVAAAGFRIAEVSEPQPSRDACEKVPRFSRWRELAAFLLMVRAERPA